MTQVREGQRVLVIGGRYFHGVVGTVQKVQCAQDNPLGVDGRRVEVLVDVAESATDAISQDWLVDQLMRYGTAVRCFRPSELRVEGE